MRVFVLMFIIAGSLFDGASFAAASKVIPVHPDRLEVSPLSVRLDRQRATRQIVVTGYFKGEPRDLTGIATYQTTGSKVIKVQAGRVRAFGNGKEIITAKIAGRTLRIPVVVTGYGRPDPVQFGTETLAVLTKQGCASGSCHGSPHGKGGFSLSLFGYDARIDRISLTRDGFNRRINAIEPDESLLLKKPMLAVPHVGGKRLRKTDAAFRVLRDWIAEGAPVELPKVACDRLTITPVTGRVLQAPYRTQQISVIAHFTDGTERDVTDIATYTSSHPNVAEVTPEGNVEGRNRGQAAISVRYLDKLESVNFTVVEPIKGFVWKPQPEHNFVDRLVNAKLKQLQYLPSPTCSDGEFLRRVSLDLTGLLPTLEQTRSFLKDHTLGKRARLIDTLLATEEYARFWALKKADLMRVSPRRLPEGRADRFADWIIQATRDNMSYDQFARTLLTATGDTERTATANYFMAIPSQEERTEMTAQIFMGTRVECAKCHNHPFENWTMRDYYRIAAVFARTRTENGLVRLASAGETQHPTTGEVMTPWGVTNAKASSVDRRATFADWLTRPDNPFFARVEVNRIWADLLGRGIVEPIDDFRSSNPPSNTPLLDTLAQEFIKRGYDRKHIIRLICNSQTYQRTRQTNAFNKTDEVLFSHARVRLLTAEQLKDAIGMTTQALPSPATIEARRAQLRDEMQHHRTQLESKFPDWLRDAADTVAKQTIRQGGWYTAGPFPMPERKEDAWKPLLPESKPFDSAETFDGGTRWIRQPDYRENGSNPLPGETGGISYLFRRIYANEPRNMRIHWNSESAKIWLNGAALTPDIVRGEKQITLPLRAGTNELRIKVVAEAPRAPFFYRMNDVPEAIPVSNNEWSLPPAISEWVAQESHSTDQTKAIRAYYMDSGRRMNDLKKQQTALEQRMEYATQRPYPELSTFTSTFGQTPRETSCTCERQSAPTLLQALELLNGGSAYNMAQEGVRHFAAQDNDTLIEELYLSALCRYPAEKEKTIARDFLQKAQDRNRAVMDLLWTVLNTQEFLFQH